MSGLSNRLRRMMPQQVTVDDLDEWATYIEALERRQWVKLDETEIIGATCECVDDGSFTMECAIDFARAIEDQIKEKNK